LFDAYKLTPNQKKIVLLGMNGREISPENIYKALSSEDRNVYDEGVTPLRNAGVLEEIRSNPAAMRLAKQKSILKKNVARLKVRVPKFK